MAEIINIICGFEPDEFWEKLGSRVDKGKIKVTAATAVHMHLSRYSPRILTTLAADCVASVQPLGLHVVTFLLILFGIAGFL